LPFEERVQEDDKVFCEEEEDQAAGTNHASRTERQYWSRVTVLEAVLTTTRELQRNQKQFQSEQQSTHLQQQGLQQTV